MIMQRLKLLILVLVVAGCAFYVEGFPAKAEEQEQEQEEGEESLWVKAVRRAPALVWAGSGVVAKGVTIGATAAAKGYVEYGVHDVVKSGLSYGASALATGVVYGANAAAKGYVDYNVQDKLATGLSYGASAVATGVAYGASAAAKGYVDYGVHEAVMNGLSYGAKAATNGAVASAQIAADMAKEGVVRGVSMASGGIPELARALSGVSYNFLTSILGLGSENPQFDMMDILANVILGQRLRNEDGGINFATAALFLEKLAVQIPGLRQIVLALKIVSFVIPQIRDAPADKTTTEHSVDVMTQALDMYFYNVDLELKRKLKEEAAPLLPAAISGDKDAALEIISVFVDRLTLKELTLSAAAVLGVGGPLQYVLRAVFFVSKYSSTVNVETNQTDSPKGQNN